MKKYLYIALSFFAMLFTLGAYRAGKDSEKKKNLEAHVKAGKDQRAAEKSSEAELKEQVNEIKSAKSSRRKFTRV